MTPPPPVGGGFHLERPCMKERDIKPGFVYHIKDLYFNIAKDDKLMRNHEGGAYRPTYFCLKDEKTGLMWVIPMSGQINKYSRSQYYPTRLAQPAMVCAFCVDK